MPCSTGFSLCSGFFSVLSFSAHSASSANSALSSSLGFLLSVRCYLTSLLLITYSLPLVTFHYAISPIPFPLPFLQYEHAVTITPRSSDAAHLPNSRSG